MRAAVITFPGSNREGDAARALKQATGRAPEPVWHADTALPAGVYAFANQPHDARLATLAWALGGYSFRRYKPAQSAGAK